MNALLTYLQESVAELRHVRWPTRKQAVRLSVIVIGFCAVSAAVFGVVDYGLSQLIRVILTSVI